MITANERRAVPRHKSFIQGRVYYNNRHSSMDCILREFTDIGARLEFSDVTGLPDKFEIYVPSKDLYFQAQVIWHKGNSLGVRWEPEESAHVPESLRSGEPIIDRLAKLEHEVALLRKRLDALQS